MIRYEMTISGAAWSQQCDSLTEAVGCALSDMATGDAWPQRIVDDGVVLWEESGPFTTGSSLRAFSAELEGVS
jgi:hypothetical protein